MPWTRARFVLDSLDDTFDGYTDGSEWNGWACPVFERDEAERIVAAFLDQPEEFGPFGARYDADADAFLFSETGDGEEPIAFGSSEIDVDGEPYTVYHIGTSYWTWEAKDSLG